MMCFDVKKQKWRDVEPFGCKPCGRAAIGKHSHTYTQVGDDGILGTPYYHVVQSWKIYTALRLPGLLGSPSSQPQMLQLEPLKH